MRRLPSPINLNLHLPKVHHHVLGHHLTRSCCAPHKSGTGHSPPSQRFPPQHRLDEKDQVPSQQVRAQHPLPRAQQHLPSLANTPSTPLPPSPPAPSTYSPPPLPGNIPLTLLPPLPPAPLKYLPMAQVCH
jgi:hypothetical protein